MLSDNEPICANCSYNCRACGEAITDEAIVTGKDTYHAHCFKCVKCDKRIQDLTYANTSKVSTIGNSQLQAIVIDGIILHYILTSPYY
jgi:hypothetical protein